MSKAAVSERLSARQRLLEAAGELFYEEGVNTVGIDRVIERAGVAKASLYNTFGSKDELIRAYLGAQHEARQARISAHLARHQDARARLLGVFDSMRENATRPGFRGCAFLRASAELKAGSAVKSVCDVSRGWLRGLFAGLAKEAGARDPEALAAQLVLLYDGAAVAAQMDGDMSAAERARALAGQLLDAAVS
ncbi:MAG TPA: TetR/AcrR family transcriptional regulator [Steroidobacteraceae bacterium]|nr:TetR/AcrR family transcriptional regulator [Steroidobacteraceae bacterium]